MNRPIHFAILFWGDHYRQHYFLDCWLRSMMAPQNLPLLKASDGHKIVVACPQEDWLNLQPEIIFHQASKHVNFQWVEIDYPSYGVDDNIRTGAILHQHKWFGHLLRSTHDPKAFGSVWSPDCIAGNGLVSAMWKWRDLGYDAVICPVLRQSEEPLLEALGDDRWLAPRTVARYSIDFLHKEMDPFIEPIHRRMTHAPYRIWRMPEGLLIHGFFGLPVFMDYSVVSSDYRDGNIDTCLRTGNFTTCKKLHIVSDSDEFGVLSLTPKDFKNYQTFPAEKSSRYEQLVNIRTAYKFFGDDWVRRQMWATPIRWHSTNISISWAEREALIERELSIATGKNPLATLRFDLPKGLKSLAAPVVERLRAP